MYKSFRQAGLTLVELMVVLAVLTILATIAYPLYTQQAQKSRRTDARVVLETIAQAQERFFTINGRYGSAAELDDPNGDGNDADSMTDQVMDRLDRNGDGTPDTYAIVINATPATFAITANAVGSQSSDDCSQLTIDQLGARGGTGSGCW